MIYIGSNVPRDKVVWAAGYVPANKKRFRMIVKQKPIQGIIMGTGYLEFYPLKRDGSVSNTRKFSVYQHIFADTYEECVAEYNRLVQEEIARLEQNINVHKQNIIAE